MHKKTNLSPGMRWCYKKLGQYVLTGKQEMLPQSKISICRLVDASRRVDEQLQGLAELTQLLL